MRLLKVSLVHNDHDVLEDPFFVILRLRVRETRLKLGLSQDRVAAEAGLPMRTYHSIDSVKPTSGRDFNPTLKTLMAIARTLGVGLDELTKAPTAAELQRLKDEDVTRSVRVPKSSRRV